MTVPVETYRGGVTIQECDAFGHLNIAYYIERFADAAHELLQPTAPGTRWRTRSIATRYLTELRAGDAISIASGLIALDAASLTLGHVASNGAGGETTTLAEQILTLDAPDGEAWAEMRDRLAPALAPWAHERFAPVAMPAGEGPLLTSLNRVKAWETDASGELSLFGFIERFSTANLVNMNAAGLTSAYMRAERRGFATFETRLELASPPPRIGETVAIQSGILELGNSSVKILHTMRLQRGRRVARFYQGGVHFDLEARRSAPLPPALRDKAREQLIRA
ncbi:MAG: acyl-CoA thioesterase [Stellaceae bacterium]